VTRRAAFLLAGASKGSVNLSFRVHGLFNGLTAQERGFCRVAYAESFYFSSVVVVGLFCFMIAPSFQMKWAEVSFKHSSPEF
jgi:hypothetical protein